MFPLIQSLWNYNVYDETATRAVYEQIVRDARRGEQSRSFAFVARKRGKAEHADGGGIIGFCHGDFFPTLWMCGKTCYLSGIITKDGERGRGVGAAGRGVTATPAIVNLFQNPERQNAQGMPKRVRHDGAPHGGGRRVLPLAIN